MTQIITQLEGRHFAVGSRSAMWIYSGVEKEDLEIATRYKQ